MTVAAPARLARMTVDDIPQVVAIDRLSFPQPWSEQSYRFELQENAHAYFIVALAPDGYGAAPAGWLARLIGRPARHIIGYAGLWLVVDEAHINTLAVHPEWRGRGLGEQLLLELLRYARGQGARLATLEVRVGNAAARRLYAKHGFLEVGRRPRYYRDGEDAVLMTVEL